MHNLKQLSNNNCTTVTKFLVTTSEENKSSNQIKILYLYSSLLRKKSFSLFDENNFHKILPTHYDISEINAWHCNTALIAENHNVKTLDSCTSLMHKTDYKGLKLPHQLMHLSTNQSLTLH